MFGKNKIGNEQLQFMTIFDTKVQVYRDPILCVNEHALIRDIQQMFRDPQEQAKNQLYTNAEDFQIFRVGYWCRQTGVITPVNQEHVVNLHEIKAIVPKAEEMRTVNQAGAGPGLVGIPST